jgi:hypothetical protein
MSKFYAVSGRLSTGDMFSSVIWARTKREVSQEIKSELPRRVSVEKFIAIDELPEGAAPLNSSKAVAFAWEKQELLTVSFVMQNINKNIRADLINDLNAVIAKYGF